MNLALSMGGTDLLTAQHAMVVELLFPGGIATLVFPAISTIFFWGKKEKCLKVMHVYIYMYIYVEQDKLIHGGAVNKLHVHGKRAVSSFRFDN